MRHVADEVGFHLRQFFLSPNKDYCIYENEKKDNAQGESRDNEPYGRHDILVFGGERNQKHIMRAGIGEKQVGIYIVFFLFIQVEAVFSL